MYVYPYVYDVTQGFMDGYLFLTVFVLYYIQTLSHCLANCTAQQIMESNIVSVLWSAHEKEIHLTCIHAAFVDAAIGSKQYQAAEQHIRNSWPTPNHATLSAKDVLRYYYLRGILHMGCCNWTMAMRCFTTCICFPSKNVVSAISVAAWKKYVLLQCLVKGDCVGFKVKTMYDTMPSTLVRLLQESASSRFQKTSIAESTVEMSDRDVLSAEQQAPTGAAVLNAYTTLTTAVAETDREAFDAIMNGPQRQWFELDGNLGLVQRVDAILLRRQLYKMGGVFSAISTQQLAQELGMPLDQVPLLLSQVRADRLWDVKIEGEYVVLPGYNPRSNSKVNMAQAQAELENMRTHLVKANKAQVVPGHTMSLESLTRGKIGGGEIEL